jgi:DNA modification methylase
MVVQKAAHPAPFSLALIPVMAKLLREYSPGLTVLDPMAGVGRIHDLAEHGPWITRGVELEQEWASQHPLTLQGDARKLPWVNGFFDAVVVSPPFANRMADSHNAQDGSYRRTYTHVLGRSLTEGNSGGMQWGEAWAEAARVLRPGGVFILNLKDHQRKGRRVHVSQWHHETLVALHLKLIDLKRVGTPGFRYGENREVRYPERLLVYRKDLQ